MEHTKNGLERFAESIEGLCDEQRIFTRKKHTASCVKNAEQVAERLKEIAQMGATFKGYAARLEEEIVATLDLTEKDLPDVVASKAVEALSFTANRLESVQAAADEATALFKELLMRLQIPQTLLNIDTDPR